MAKGSTSMITGFQPQEEILGSTLAIAAVSAVLKNLLENGLIERAVTPSIGSDVIVSACPPDRITVGADERPQINLFLYHLGPNTGLRTRPEPGSDKENGSKRPRLALDLHYMLTAYGTKDFHTEILLGYTLELFQETRTLSRDAIRAALAAGNGSAEPFASSALAEQLGEMTVRPQFPGPEEMSRLWSGLQARFRPSAAYKVSTVVIG